MTRIRAALALYAAIIFMFLGGCSTPAVDPKDETLSMVYGYMGGNPTLFGPMRWAKLKENSQPPVDHDLEVTRDFWERGGLFWHVGVKPGSYQLGDYGLPDIRFLYGKVAKNITIIRIGQPGVYYMGSYWHENNSKVIATGFEIERANKPTEREILQRLIKEFESEGHNKIYPRQYELLKKRLAQLPK